MSAETPQQGDAKAPVKPGVGGMASRLVGFLSATRGEMKKVTWPSRDELVKATRMILVLSVAVGLFIGLLDWFFGKVLIDGVAALAR